MKEGGSTSVVGESEEGVEGEESGVRKRCGGGWSDARRKAGWVR